MNLWLIGMMGAGKTTSGLAAALRLGVGFIDTDTEVEKSSGMPIHEIWQKRGEGHFRDLESIVVASIEPSAAAIVATGGGAVINPVNVAHMEQTGTLVWLNASPQILDERMSNTGVRPLLDEGVATLPRLTEIYEERRNIYESAAHHVLNTDYEPVESVVDRLVELWKSS